MGANATLRWPWTDLDAALQGKGKHSVQDLSEITEANFEGVLAWLKADADADTGKFLDIGDQEPRAEASRANSASSSSSGREASPRMHVPAQPAPSTSSGSYHSKIFAWEPKILVEATARDLFSGLIAFFREGDQSKLFKVDFESLHCKAAMFCDSIPVDVEVRVFEADEVGSSCAVFSHLSRSDSVRLAHTFQLAAQHLTAVGFTVLQPREGVADSCLRLLEDDMSISDDDFSGDDEESPAADTHAACSGGLHRSASIV